MAKLLDREMNRILLAKHIRTPEEKAADTAKVISHILSRHYGREIKVTDCRVDVLNTFPSNSIIAK